MRDVGEFVVIGSHRCLARKKGKYGKYFGNTHKLSVNIILFTNTKYNFIVLKYFHNISSSVQPFLLSMFFITIVWLVSSPCFTTLTHHRHHPPKDNAGLEDIGARLPWHGVGTVISIPSGYTHETSVDATIWL